jgi:hypothetical protein
MHLLVILLQQLLGMLPSKQPVPQAEVVRPRPAEPRNSDSAFAGLERTAFGGAGGYWTILPMLAAKGTRAPGGAEIHRRQISARTVPPDINALDNTSKAVDDTLLSRNSSGQE